MTFKKSLSCLLVLLALFQSVWAQDSKSSTKSASVLIDAPRKSFQETEEGRAYLKLNGQLPEVEDIYGYPLPKTPLKQQRPRYELKKIEKAKLKPILKPAPKILPKKKNPNVKTSFFKTILDFIIPSAAAYDADSNVPGLINCRPANLPSNAGYFKAYFEDIADSTDVGYDDGTARVSAICDVLEEIADIIMLNEPGGATPEILFSKTWPSDAPAVALATGSPYIPVLQAQAKTHSGFLHQHIVSRNDPSPGPDAVVNTNWASNISWSVDSSLNAGTFDFKTVMRHEILHAMGFMSRLPANVSTTNIPAPHNHWDRSLLSPTNSFITSALSPLLQVPVGAPSLWFKNDASIYNGKKNYVNAPLNGERPLFTPSSWQQGSSLSHFDMNRLTPPNSQTYVMHPSIAMGVQKIIHNHEKEVLCHLGYQVRSMTGCELPTPIANDDIGLINSAYTCVSFLTNDYSPNGGELSLESYELILPTAQWASWASMMFYTSSDCTVTPGQTFSYNTFSGAQTVNAKIRSIKVTTGNYVSQVVMKYRIKHSVSNRISDPAEMNYSKCVVASDEYVCNGNFEMPTPSTNITMNGGFSLWGIGLNTPDPVFKNLPTAHDRQNLPWTPWTGTTVDMVDNGTKSVFMANNAATGNQPNNEKIATRLKSPLTPGNCYRLAFDITMLNMNAPSPFNIMASLSTSNLNVPNNLQLNPALDSAITILNQPVTLSSGAINAQWYNITRTFSPSQPYEYLAIHMPDPTTVPAIGGFGIFSWVDNVSLKQVAPNLCPSNSISGVVYNDIYTNGSMGPGEGVLQSVNVALVDAVNGTVIDETITNQNGEYKFNAVAPAPEYFVVLKPENLFQTITEPLTNNLLSNYQYTRLVQFTNGGVVTGENFGVLLSGQSPQAAPPMTLSAIPKMGCSSSQGSIDLNVPGGMAPYTYSWNNGQTTQDLSGITSGSYSVTVTDSSSPAQTATLSVSVPVFVPISVNGVVSGNNINVTASGNAPLTYAWSSGQSTEDLSNVSAGTYTITVTDNNKCTQTASFNIVPLDQAQNGICCKVKPNANPLINCSDPIMNLGHSTVELGHNRCVAANGGNSCYWDFSNPACCYPGAAGCASSGLILTTTRKPSCDGKSGGIALTVNGGIAPYTYSWSDGQTTQNANNIAPGTYTVTVTDANGLTGTATVTLQNIGPVVISGAVTGASAPSFNNGVINITATPAVGYNYAWTKSGGGWSSTSEDVSNLVVGSYTVMATNEFSCKASKSFTVKKILKIVPKEVIQKQ
jgi:hypothetical protein